MLNKDLKQLEQQIFLSYFQDGIVDIFVGIMFLFNGMLMFTDNSKFAGLAIIFTLLISPVKKMIILPRAGYVKFRVTREQKIKKSFLMTMIAGILVLNIVLFGIMKKGSSQFLQDYAFIFVGGFISLLPIFGAIITGVKRFYVYGILIFLVFAHENMTYSTAPVDFMLFGMVLLVVGLYFLIQFLKKYPLPTEENIYDPEK